MSYPLHINSLGFLDLFTQSNDTFEFLLLHLGWLVNPAVQEVVVLQFTGPHLYITGRRFDVHRCRWFLRRGKSHFLSAIKHQIFSKNEFDVQDMYKWYEFICVKIFLIRIKILTNPKTKCQWVPLLTWDTVWAIKKLEQSYDYTSKLVKIDEYKINKCITISLLRKEWSFIYTN